MTGLEVSGVAIGTCSVTCPVDGQDFVVRAHRFNCNPKTAEQWAALGCIFANPSATTAFDLGTHNRVTPTASCEVSCPVDGEDFVVIRVTGLTAISDNNIFAAVDEWVGQPVIAAAKYGDITWWDVGAVTSMVRLFEGRGSFDEPLSHW